MIMAFLFIHGFISFTVINVLHSCFCIDSCLLFIMFSFILFIAFAILHFRCSFILFHYSNFSCSVRFFSFDLQFDTCRLRQHTSSP
jgi:hypothetical protein